VSKSPDGDILIRTLRRDGFGFVRGSTGRTGGLGFRQLLSALHGGAHLGLAVDGPKGPFGDIREGVVQLSRHSQRPIVPLLFSSGRHRVLRTWDRTIVPFPFSSVTVREAEPLQVPAEVSGSTVERWRRRLRNILLPRPAGVPEKGLVRGGQVVEGTGHAAADSG
jgi:lysophospholipid acyltransferase (LPLAT)-like uncharacterized protein